MSTKIYNAYEMPAMSMKQLLEFKKELALIVAKEYYKRLRHLQLETLVDLADNLTINDMKGNTAKVEEILKYYSEYLYPKKEFSSNKEGILNKELILLVFSYIRKKSKEKSDYLDSVDLSAEIVLFPISNKRTLFMTFSNEFSNLFSSFFNKDSEYKDIITKYKIKDYHYQNQTDRPEDISSKEWNKRERDWEKCLNNIPGADGIPVILMDEEILSISYRNQSVSMKNYLEILKSDSTKEDFTDKDSRVKKRAYSLLFDDYCSQNKINPFYISDYMDVDKVLKESINSNEDNEIKKLYESFKLKVKENLKDINTLLGLGDSFTIRNLIPNYIKESKRED